MNTEYITWRRLKNSVRNHQLPSYVFSCQIKIRLYTHIESPSKKRIAHCNQVEPFQSAPFLSSAATARPWARIKRVVFTWAGKRWRFECLSVFFAGSSLCFSQTAFWNPRHQTQQSLQQRLQGHHHQYPSASNGMTIFQETIICEYSERHFCVWDWSLRLQSNEDTKPSSSSNDVSSFVFWAKSWVRKSLSAGSSEPILITWPNSFFSWLP